MILGSTPVGPDCSQRTDLAPITGSLQAGSDRFVTSFTIASSLPAKPSNSGERNDFYGEEIIFSYRAENQKPAISFDDESLPISFFIQVGAADSVLVLDLIASGAKAKVPNLAEGSTLYVTVKLKGKTSGGTTVESNEATFPIRIVGSCVGSPSDGTGACANPKQC
ncbi:hypothetical protein [Stigmatella erecta]|nr:hypothetical protein [Stigmatella erecta]